MTKLLEHLSDWKLQQLYFLNNNIMKINISIAIYIAQIQRLYDI